MSEEKLTPEEWAAWALLGDPYYRPVPLTLRELARRVADAVRGAVRDEAHRREGVTHD